MSIESLEVNRKEVIKKIETESGVDSRKVNPLGVKKAKESLVLSEILEREDALGKIDDLEEKYDLILDKTKDEIKEEIGILKECISGEVEVQPNVDDENEKNGMDVKKNDQDELDNEKNIKKEKTPQEAIEGLSKKVGGHEDVKVAQIIEEKIRRAEKPLNEEQKDSIHNEAIGGLSQEDKKTKEGEQSIVRDMEESADDNK